MSSEISTAKYVDREAFKRDTGMYPEEFDANQDRIAKEEAFRKRIETGIEESVSIVLQATPAVLAHRAAETQRANARGVLTDGMETTEGKE